MPLLRTEAEKLDRDMLRRGVIETIIEESPVMDYLPFVTVEGNSYKYNRETTLGGAAFYAVNAQWTEAPATFTTVTADVAILGGDVDVDNFLQRVRGSVNDQRAIQTQLKAKSVARAFENAFLTGYQTTDPNSFVGLKYLLTSDGSPATAGQVLEVSTSGGALTLALLDQMLDLIKGGKPDILLMSRRSRRKLKALLTASAHYVENGTTDFGRQVMFYDGIPVFISDFQSDAETGSSSGTGLSSIYAIQFNEDDGLFGLQNGDMEVVEIGQLETKDAWRIRMRWYVGLALGRLSAAARLSSISSS